MLTAKLPLLSTGRLKMLAMKLPLMSAGRIEKVLASKPPLKKMLAAKLQLMRKKG